jgi:poly-beta-1,6-N-acetyl-D-glucosamine synthase
MIFFLIVVFTFFLFFYLGFLYWIYIGLNNLENSGNNIPDEFVSIIIPFRNESENILQSLKSLEAQRYPADKFEIIYVNDLSTDNSLQIVSENKTRENTRILNLTASYGGGKKKAIQYGIENSVGSIIVTTDSDCIHSKDWLISLTKCFDKNTAMIAGPIEFTAGNSLFEQVQRLEFAALITAGAGLIGAGTPFICNAANLAYRKDVFNDLKGFNDNINLASGDDEFLMQKINRATDLKIKFCIDKKSIVRTKGNKTVREFFKQRKRWASKGLFYQDRIRIIVLLSIFLFYLGLIIQGILSFFSFSLFLLFIISLWAKILSEYLVMKKAAALLFDSGILRYFLITELLQVPYIVAASIMGTIGGLKWKNRAMNR